MNPDIIKYNKKLKAADFEIAEKLLEIISNNLKRSESKIWHGHPVWFIDGNPIVGYHKLKDCVRILFWSGQSFKEKGLVDEGSFKAAGKSYTELKQVKVGELKTWLKKSVKIQWDYKNIVKRKGVLVKI